MEKNSIRSLEGKTRGIETYSTNSKLSKIQIIMSQKSHNLKHLNNLTQEMDNLNQELVEMREFNQNRSLLRKTLSMTKRLS